MFWQPVNALIGEFFFWNNVIKGGLVSKSHINEPEVVIILHDV